MGFFGMGGNKGCKKADDRAVQRSCDSVAIAKKRMGASKSQRDAQEQQWAADEAELARLADEEAADQAKAKISTWTPKTEGKPPVKSAMKKKSKFAGAEADE